MPRIELSGEKITEPGYYELFLVEINENPMVSERTGKPYTLLGWKFEVLGKWRKDSATGAAVLDPLDWVAYVNVSTFPQYGNPDDEMTKIVNGLLNGPETSRFWARNVGDTDVLLGWQGRSQIAIQPSRDGKGVYPVPQNYRPNEDWLQELLSSGFRAKYGAMSQQPHKPRYMPGYEPEPAPARSAFPPNAPARHIGTTPAPAPAPGFEPPAQGSMGDFDDMEDPFAE